MTRGARSTGEVWDRHWEATHGPGGSWFGRLATLVRKQLLSRAVRHYAGRWFAPAGLFVECGCGTAQSSSRLAGAGRRFVALDISRAALSAARRVPVFGSFVNADLFRLPLAEGSVAGVWNLGVMEHFEEAQGIAILREIRRALAPGGVAILFWPPEYGSSRLVLAPIEAALSLVRRREVNFFPDEVNRLRSRAHAREMLGAAGLEPAAVELSPRDLFIHVVVVARKPA